MISTPGMDPKTLLKIPPAVAGKDLAGKGKVISFPGVFFAGVTGSSGNGIKSSNKATGKLQNDMGQGEDVLWDGNI
jgi:hypothetical protein